MIYLPEPSTVTLAVDLTGWDAESWNLTDRRVETIRWDVSDGKTVIRQPDALNDLLVVFSR